MVVHFDCSMVEVGGDFFGELKQSMGVAKTLNGVLVGGFNPFEKY